MKTYQDLTALGDNERERMEFVRSAVRDHLGSADYRIAAAAEEYYAKRNTTIERFQKMLYTATGQAYPDLYSSNFRLKTLFFRRFVIQQTQYVLSNGVTFENQETKKKLVDLILKITLPCMIFNSFNKPLTPQILIQTAMILAVAFCISILSIYIRSII